MIPSVEADYLLRVIESHIKPLNEKIEELREMINNSKEAIPSEQEKGFWCTYCKSPKSKCICSTKEAIPDRQPSPSGGDAIEFGEWIHEQGYEPWGATGLWHNIANRKIIPDKIFTTEQLYQQFKETTSNKVTKGDK